MLRQSEIVWEFNPADYHRTAYFAAFDQREQVAAEDRAIFDIDERKYIGRSRNGFSDGTTVRGIFPVSGLPKGINGYDPEDEDIKIDHKMGEYVLAGRITFKQDGLMLRQNERADSLWVPAQVLLPDVSDDRKHVVRLGIKLDLEGDIFIGYATSVPLLAPKGRNTSSPFASSL